MFTLDKVWSTTTGALEPVPLRSANRAVPFGLILKVHSMVIHLSRSGARSAEAMSGAPDVLYARARSVSLLPLRLGSRVIHGPPFVAGVLSWNMCENLLVPCSVVGMNISYMICHVSLLFIFRAVPPATMPLDSVRWRSPPPVLSRSSFQMLNR